MDNSWNDFSTSNKNLLEKIDNILLNEKRDYHPKNVYRVFEDIKPENVKVIIVGQDPYPDINKATGRAFETNPDIKIKDSMKNILKELKNDLNIDRPNGYLQDWSDQGVLLLNRCLTYTEKSGHLNEGIWDDFFINIIRYLHDLKKGKIVYILWGKKAQTALKKCKLDDPVTLISGHPSPLSVKHFLGCKHFSKCNELLISMDESIISW